MLKSQRGAGQVPGEKRKGIGLEKFFVLIFCLFRAAPAAYMEIPRLGGQIRTVAAGLHHSHSNGGIRTAFVTYTTAQGNTGSLTH